MMHMHNAYETENVQSWGIQYMQYFITELTGLRTKYNPPIKALVGFL